MTNGFLYPIRVSTRLSPWLLAMVYGVHAVSVVVLLLVPIPTPARSALIAGVVFGIYRFDSRHRRRIDPRYPLEVHLDHHDEWRLKMPDGELLAAGLQPCSFVHPLLVVLRFRIKSARPAVILTPDMVDADLLRRLRVRIKYRRTAPVMPRSMRDPGEPGKP